jgi:glycosyltransferase involved in cell wall biosynthesis
VTGPAERERRVAIVHERFTELGGSERCVEQLHELWPEAPIHAAVLDRAALPPGLRDADIRPTWLQRLYRDGPRYAQLLPLLPMAMRGIDVGDVDVVVTSHHAFANRVHPPVGIPVVAYTHTPARWIWEPGLRRNEVGGRVGAAALDLFARTQQRPDRAAARRLAGVVANSRHVAARIRRWWGRDAEVVHPPVAIDFHTPDPKVGREDFFLLAGRLVPYKRPELAVAAARAAGVRLVVAGDGRSRRAVEAAAGPRTELLGSVDDETLRDLFRRCRALVFPGEEDFGIVPVEAQACGAPVIAPAVGGVLDSVVDGKTGVLYRGVGVEPLAAVLRSFDPDRFDPLDPRLQAERFAPHCFRNGMSAAICRFVGPVPGQEGPGWTGA